MTDKGGVDNQSSAAGDDEQPLRSVPHPRSGAVYNPSRDREKMRGGLATGLLSALIILIGSLVVVIASGRRTWDELEGVATLTFGPLVSLTATMLGFYFGQKDR